MDLSSYTRERTWKCPRCGYIVKVRKGFARGASTSLKKNWTRQLAEELQRGKSAHQHFCRASSAVKKNNVGCLAALILAPFTIAGFALKLLFGRNPLLPALGLFVTAVLFRNFWWVWIPVVVTLLIILAIQGRRMQFVAKTLEEIDAMDGPEFERYLVSFFSARGCTVIHSGRSGDFGADLIVVDDGIKFAVQAKNYDTGKVSNKAVQEAFTAASYYRCDRAMVVTNAQFTDPAREQARRCTPPVVLMGRDELEYLIKGMV